MANSVDIAANLVRDTVTPGLQRLVNLLDQVEKKTKEQNAGGLFSGILGGLGAVVDKFTTLTGLLTTGLGVSSIRTFSEFERGLFKVAVQAENSKLSLEEIGRAVQDIGLRTGNSFDTLNSALLEAVSSGVEVSKSLRLVEVAARAATAGGTDTITSLKGLLTIINGYGLAVEDATRVSDTLFQSLKTGRATVEELSRFLGLVVPISRQVGLSFDETVAAINALTQSGLSTERAVVSLRAVLQGLVNPTIEASKFAQKLGIDLSASAVAGGKFASFLTLVAEKTNLNQTAIERLFGNIRAYTAINSLAADSTKNLSDNLELLKTKAGATDRAFETITNSLPFKLDKLKVAFDNFQIALGKAAEPLIAGIADKFTGLLDAIASRQGTLTAVFQSIQVFANQLVETLGTIVNQGDILKFVGNTVRAAIQLIVDLLVAALPTIGTAALAIGKSIGRAIVSGLLTEANKSLLDIFKSGGNFILEKFVLPAEVTADLQRRANEIKKLEAQFDAKNNELLARKDTFVGDKKRSDELLKELEAIDKKIKELEAGAPQGTGNDALKAAFDLDAETVRKSAGSFVDKAKDALATAIATLPAGLKDASQAALQKLFDTVSKIIPDIIGKGAAADAAARAARELAKKTAEEINKEVAAVGNKVLGGNDKLSAVDINVIQQKLRETISEVQSGLEVLTAKRAQTKALLDGGLISSEEGRQRELDAVDEYKTKFEEVDTLIAKLKEQGKDGFVALAFLDDDIKRLESFRRKTKETVDAQENLFTGVEKGIRDTVTKMDELQELGAALGAQLANSFVDFIVQVAQGKKAFSEFAISFLAKIGEMILQAAIFRAISGIFGFAPTQVPAPPQAKNAGGYITGPNINRDVVNVAATPGEFMVNAGATSYYGASVISAINKRMVPRNLLAGFAAGHNVDISRRFSSGGEVSAALRPSGPITAPALVIADEQAGERLYAGSPNALDRILHERRALSGNGSGRTR